MKALNILGRIALVIAGLLVVFIAVLAGIIIVDAQTGSTAADYSNVTFTASDGADINAYLAQPEGYAPHAAVLMVHEWWGMNAEITELADRLAEQGYVVLVPDTYRGATTASIPRAIYLRVSTDETRVDADMDAAYNYLISLPEVDAQRIGVIGFCYGGGVALRHSVRNPEIAATVNLYGDRITDPTAFGALLDEGAGPVFGIFAAEDMSIPLEEVDAFAAALSQAGVTHQITVYNDVGHAFVQPDLIDQPGSPQDAWLDTLAFLDEHVRYSCPACDVEES